MTLKRAPVNTLTEAERDQIGAAAHRTFNYIAGDFMTLIQESEGRSYIKQDEVIEMVLDATRIVEIGRLPMVLAHKLYAMEFKQVDELMKRIFPAKRYS